MSRCGRRWNCLAARIKMIDCTINQAIIFAGTHELELLKLVLGVAGQMNKKRSKPPKLIEFAPKTTKQHSNLLILA